MTKQERVIVGMNDTKIIEEGSFFISVGDVSDGYFHNFSIFNSGKHYKYNNNRIYVGDIFETENHTFYIETINWSDRAISILILPKNTNQ